MPAKKTDTPPAGLNLDALEHEVGDDPTPFTLRGKTFSLRGVNTLDMEVALEIDETEPRKMLEALLGEKDFERFWNLKPSVKEVNTLMKTWREKNGMPELGEFDASPTS